MDGGLGIDFAKLEVKRPDRPWLQVWLKEMPWLLLVTALVMVAFALFNLYVLS
jgi:hypothetical protein